MMSVIRFIRRLFLRRSQPSYQVGELVRYNGRAMAISRIAGGAAELVWQDDHRSLHTAGWVPVKKLNSKD